MSYFLFLDESGHDHKITPYEVWGGVALHIERLWYFVRNVQQLQLSCFGAPLERFRTEIKGTKLLDRDRFKWAAQAEPLSDAARREHCRRFLEKGLRHQPPTYLEFAAYGQASLLMAELVMKSLRDHKATLFAAAIPKQIPKPRKQLAADYLRKDLVFLLERYYYFLRDQDCCGVIVMDESEKREQRKMISRMERYFTSTRKGLLRLSNIVPAPLFVASDLTYPVQAADLCIYCINWGFRLPKRGMDAESRQEIADKFGDYLFQLQYEGEIDVNGQRTRTYGVVFVPDPYNPAYEKGGNAFGAAEAAPGPNLQ